MVGRTTIAWSTGCAAVYFGVFGIQNGLLLICSLSSFLIGGHIGCCRHVYTSWLLVTLLLLHSVSVCDSQDCSREKSRQARSIVSRVVAPLYSLKRLDIPVTCPLSPANDKYASQEVMKRRLGSKWMCSVCGKKYSEEEELESHLGETHQGPAIDGCLADYCDILRCEPYFDGHREQPECNEASISELKLKCMDMVRDKCSPTHLSPEDRLQVEVMVQASICSYLTCDDYWTTPEEDPIFENYYHTVYAVSFCLLLVLLAIYFKIASSNIDNSVSIETMLAEADTLRRPKPAIIPPDYDDMEIRHRNPVTERQWSEHE